MADAGSGPGSRSGRRLTPRPLGPRARSTTSGVSSPLVSAAHLISLLRERAPSLLDVRWELGKGPGRDRYELGHVPGAAFVDLDRELAGPPGAEGRHPLPETAAFEAAMRAAGVSGARPVVVYDAGPSTSAARAWWLLRYFGHPDVRVLDGGLAAWAAASGPLASGIETIEPGDFDAQPGHLEVLDAAGVASLARRGVLLDSRAPERFTGELEPVDPVAGHIPGARNRPTTSNVASDGRLRPPAELRDEFARLGAREGTPIAVYCGSGVTAAHQVLALEVAGFEAALYPGSWSGWITDPSRPVATGAE